MPAGCHLPLEVVWECFSLFGPSEPGVGMLYHSEQSPTEHPTGQAGLWVSTAAGARHSSNGLFLPLEESCRYLKELAFWMRLNFYDVLPEHSVISEHSSHNQILVFSSWLLRKRNLVD